MFLINAFFRPLKSRYSAMGVFATHFVFCLIILIVGGLITQGGRSRGSFAAADVFRYLGYLLSLFLAIAFIICLTVLRGGLTFTYFWFIEIPACAFQLLAWILDAVNAAKLDDTFGDSYGLAVASAILGVFCSIFTLMIAIGLSKMRLPLAEMCGGTKDCCGAETHNEHVAEHPNTDPNVAAHDRPVEATQPTGKQSV